MSGRPIDRAEPAIVRVMQRCDAGSGLRDACQHVATDYAITADRLEHLTRVWCAIGGFPVPAEPAAMIPRRRVPNVRPCVRLLGCRRPRRPGEPYVLARRRLDPTRPNQTSPVAELAPGTLRAIAHQTRPASASVRYNYRRATRATTTDPTRQPVGSARVRGSDR
jgi:hypothetical protein